MITDNSKRHSSGRSIGLNQKKIRLLLLQPAVVTINSVILLSAAAKLDHGAPTNRESSADLKNAAIVAIAITAAKTKLAKLKLPAHPC